MIISPGRSFYAEPVMDTGMKRSRSLQGCRTCRKLKSGLFCLDGEGWMIMDYPDSKTLARVILKLNLPELYRKMGLAAEQTTGSGMIYVYDSRGVPVFSDMLAYPGADKSLVSEQERKEDGKEILPIGRRIYSGLPVGQNRMVFYTADGRDSSGCGDAQTC